MRRAELTSGTAGLDAVRFEGEKQGCGLVHRNQNPAANRMHGGRDHLEIVRVSLTKASATVECFLSRSTRGGWLLSPSRHYENYSQRHVVTVLNFILQSGGFSRQVGLSTLRHYF